MVFKVGDRVKTIDLHLALRPGLGTISFQSMDKYYINWDTGRENDGPWGGAELILVEAFQGGTKSSEEESKFSSREALLRGALEAVTKQRNNQYGPPTQDFDKVAKAATTYGFSFNGEPLRPHHVAIFQTLVKLSRITWSPDHQDSWMDLAGYAACGYECVEKENE